MSDLATAVLPQSPPETRVPPGDFRTARLVAIIAGVLGTLCALATPFLPITQTTATLNWPQHGVLDNVQAPLMSQVPVDLSVTIPCAAVGALPPQGGILLATAPPQGEGASLQAMFVRVSPTGVDVVDRNAVVVSAKRQQMAGCSTIHITSNNKSTRAEFVGLRGEDGKPLTGTMDSDLRPQIVGVFTDLTGGVPEGLAFRAQVDTRFSSSPTVTKLLAMILAVLCTAIALVALAKLDSSDGRKHRRFLPATWWQFTWADAAVLGTLLVWHFIGANTSDDGYILTMMRTAGHAGYMSNYFRWFGVPEAPFGWYYYVIQAFAEVSTASVWVRLPALFCAVLCWMVISREVVPRLGRGLIGPLGRKTATPLRTGELPLGPLAYGVATREANRAGSRTQRMAGRLGSVPLWTGGLVFLAFWLPYDNGLRSEPIVAIGALLTWVSLERAIATARLLPAAVAVLVAAFTLAAAPTGLMCVAALLAAIRPLTRLVVRRRKEHGLAALLLPIAAAGFLVLTVVYGDQSFAAIQEANRVRQDLGPNLAWYDDYLRYYYLFVETVDGSLPRRFAFLAMILCLVTTTLVLLRRRRVPGIAAAPTWRLIGVVFGTMFFMMFDPTKWTHHFGTYAGIAGSLAAVTAVAVSATALRSRKNQAIFLAALLFTLAISFSGINGYWYVSCFGVPWWDKRVSLHGLQSDTVVLGFFALALALVGWHLLREGYAKPPSSPATRRGRRIRKFAAMPLTVAAAAMVMFEVLSMAKGAVAQYPAFSLARSNFQALAGKSCGLADDVLVEADPNESRLIPIIDPKNPPANPNDPLAGGHPVAFTPNGVPDDLSADDVPIKPGTSNTSSQSVGGDTAKGQNAGTGGGKGAQGVNGSTVALPFGLDPATTPVLGSYQDGIQQPARVTSSWYRLPARTADTPLITITAAGRIQAVGENGTQTYGQSLVLEYGKQQPDGSVTGLGKYIPRDVGPAPSWRNLRIPRSGIAPDADVVRIVADDPILIGDQWLAFTPPRVPKLQTINTYLGSTQPILLDWAVALQFPCQRPFDHRNGVAEVPRFRILPDHPLAVSSTDTWEAAEFGGPLGFSQMLARSTTIPTYLNDDWARDWGSLERYDQYYEGVPADLALGSATRSGFWTPGKMRE